MEIIISHRGNLNGPNPELENRPEYIETALSAGYDVEVDLWYKPDECGWYLGHDAPTYKIMPRMLLSHKIWVHCKDIVTLGEFLLFSHLRASVGEVPHFFFHQTDDCALVSSGYIWTYPGKIISHSFSIAVKPESVEAWDISGAAGVCTDYPEIYKL